MAAAEELHFGIYDMPRLTDEERAAEHGLRHDLLLKLYDELEPAFDVSLSWPVRKKAVIQDGLGKKHTTRIEILNVEEWARG